MTAEEKLDELQTRLEVIYSKLERKQGLGEPAWKKPGRKNSHLHILIETPLMDQVEKEARENNISIGEFVRRKLRNNPQLNRIENKLDMILRK